MSKFGHTFECPPGGAFQAVVAEWPRRSVTRPRPPQGPRSALVVTPPRPKAKTGKRTRYQRQRPPDQGHSRIARRNQTDRATPARPHLPRPQPHGNRGINHPAYASGSPDRSKGAQTCRLAPAPPNRRNSPCDLRSHPNTHDTSADDPTADNPARSTPRCDGGGRARHSSGQSPRAACECGYPASYSCS